VPEHPEIYVDTTRNSAEESAATIVEKLRIQGRLGSTT
jgi:adenylylsulfate kinase-like enzyme